MDRLSVLRAFVRLVELGTFSAVAEDLGIKQSTVSKWVAALETELGARLVERTTRRLRVTPAGHTFYARARGLLTQYEDAVAEVQQHAPTLAGRLRISVPVVFGRLFVTPWLAEFCHAHPAIELEVVYDDRYSDLIGADLDVAVRVGAPVDATWNAKRIGGSERRCVAAPGYLEAHGRPQTPQDLADHAALVHSGLPPGKPWVFEREGKKARARLQVRFRANNSEALREAARGGVGVALLADWLVDEDVRRGKLEVLFAEYTLPPAPIYALGAPGQRFGPRARVFVERLQQELRSVGL